MGLQNMSFQRKKVPICPDASLLPGAIFRDNAVLWVTNIP